MPQPKTRAARLKCKNCGNSVLAAFRQSGIPSRSTIKLDDDDPAATLVEPQLTDRSVINWMMTIQPRRSCNAMIFTGNLLRQTLTSLILDPTHQPGRTAAKPNTLTRLLRDAAARRRSSFRSQRGGAGHENLIEWG
jgi:hypothetical protein